MGTNLIQILYFFQFIPVFLMYISFPWPLSIWMSIFALSCFQNIDLETRNCKSINALCPIFCTTPQSEAWHDWQNISIMYIEGGKKISFSVSSDIHRLAASFQIPYSVYAVRLIEKAKCHWASIACWHCMNSIFSHREIFFLPTVSLIF